MTKKRINLDQTELPRHWTNPLPLFGEPLDPPLDPETDEPMEAEKMMNLLPEECVRQEISKEKEIPIPEEVVDNYKLWRPTPLVRATNLEEFLNTPAKIFYKYEGASPPGSHKPNTSIPQAFFAKEEGTEKLTTETGAGQWGSALGFASSLFDLQAKIFMVKVSYRQKPYRKSMIESWGAEITPSPSRETEAGKSFLDEDPDTNGSLGMAISEAVEIALSDPKIKYSLGSVLNHVLIHQSILGLETKKQLKKIGIKPDILIGCTGGGSNFGGLILPFLPEILSEERNIELIATEPTACPTLTKGKKRYDFADSAGMTPKIKMYTLGNEFVPPGIHAGGLRYHGMAPILCKLKDLGYLRPQAYQQTDTFEDAVTFSRLEGFIPAPETTHAVHGAIRAAKRAKDENSSPTIVFNFSGHGHFDMSAYDAYLSDELVEVEH